MSETESQNLKPGLYIRWRQVPYEESPAYTYSELHYGWSHWCLVDSETFKLAMCKGIDTTIELQHKIIVEPSIDKEPKKEKPSSEDFVEKMVRSLIPLVGDVMHSVCQAVKEHYDD